LLLEDASGGDDLVGAGGGSSLNAMENGVDGVGGQREVIPEGITGVGVVASSYPKEKRDGGVDRPSVCSEFLCKFDVLFFFTFQGLLEAGVASVPDFQNLEGC
jgi:hypothetical protein